MGVWVGYGVCVQSGNTAPKYVLEMPQRVQNFNLLELITYLNIDTIYLIKIIDFACFLQRQKKLLTIQGLGQPVFKTGFSFFSPNGWWVTHSWNRKSISNLYEAVSVILWPGTYLFVTSVSEWVEMQNVSLTRSWIFCWHTSLLYLRDLRACTQIQKAICFTHIAHNHLASSDWLHRSYHRPSKRVCCLI